MTKGSINRKSFLNPRDTPIVEKIAGFIDELRPFEGERVADVDEAVADMLVRDVSEDDRRLRTELVWTVASTRPAELPSTLDPEDIRLSLFTEAWEKGLKAGVAEGDLFSVDCGMIFNSVAARFGISASQVSQAMFADTPGERQLVFPAGERNEVAREAIIRLNLERLRRGLRRAVRVDLEIPSRSQAGTSYVNLLWGAKRLGLMYDVSEVESSVILNVSGPYALFGRTTMYGNRLFEFVYIVLENAGNKWRLKVDLIAGEGDKSQTLRNLWLDASLRHHFIHERHQTSYSMRSGDEEAFQKYFEKLSSPWRLYYEGALVPLGEPGRRTLMVPDFVARCPFSPAEVFVEIVGFWKREYLERKMEKVRLLGKRHMVLIVNAKLCVAREELLMPGTDLIHVFFYSGREELKRVAERVVVELERIGDKV